MGALGDNIVRGDDDSEWMQDLDSLLGQPEFVAGVGLAALGALDSEDDEKPAPPTRRTNGSLVFLLAVGAVLIILALLVRFATGA